MNDQEIREKAFTEAAAAAETCRKRAEWCARIGLFVLAREYDHFAKSITRGIEWQRNAIAPKSPAMTTDAEIEAVIEQNRTEQNRTEQNRTD